MTASSLTAEPTGAYLLHPAKHDDLVSSYGVGGLSITVVATVLLTAGGTALIQWLSGGADTTGILVVLWAAALLQVPTLVWAGRLLRKDKFRSFQRVYWVQSLLQFTWLQLLCWSTTPTSWILGVAVFWAWAFNDGWVFYDAPQVRLQYLVAIPLFDLILVGFDFLGFEGLIHLHGADSTYFWALVGNQLLIILLSQVIISFVGKQARSHDERWIRTSEVERELALLKRERDVIQKSCVFLTKGLSASRFSHDVASPISALMMNVSLLREAVSARPEEATDPSAPPGAAEGIGFIEELLEDTEMAASRIMQMTSVLARSVRENENQAPREVRHFIEDAVEELRVATAGHSVPFLRPDVSVIDCEIHTTGACAAALGNILTNGALHATEEALAVRGLPVGPYFYQIRIRDFGVEPDKREEALDRVRASLAFLPRERETSADGGEHHRGYGIGLMLAKVHFVRHNGWLSAEAPAEGRGLEMRVTLPRTRPDLIPVLENRPEDPEQAAS